MISCIILAAGTSRRFGGLKQVHRIRNVSFLEMILARLSSLKCDKEIIIGVGYKRETVVRELKRINFTGKIVVNREYRKGQLSTFQACLKSADKGTRGVLMILSDHPLVLSATYKRLYRAFRLARSKNIIIPVYHGQKGHPVMFPPEVFPDILRSPREQGARSVMKKYFQKVKLIPVKDQFILADIDDKEMLKRYFKHIE
ncbi:MAG: nucleotidyltransferase family protein [bacterium]|nr:nucleotidyltransferase family protein [bacterium]